MGAAAIWGTATPREREPWLGVELRHLAALDAVARERSFSAAADQLGYVQSAISQQIAMLEKRVGTRLVDRGRGTLGIRLTPAGETLVGHANDIVRSLAAAQADLRSLMDGAGTLRLGLDSGLAANVLPTLLPLVKQVSVSPALETVEASDDVALFQSLEHGELDLALGRPPSDHSRFNAVELTPDPFVLVVPSDSPMARSPKPVTAEDLASMTVVGTRAARSIELFSHDDRDGQPAFAHVVHAEATAQRLVRSGVGVAIMSELAVDPTDTETTLLSLDHLVPARSLVLAWNVTRRRPLDVEVLHQCAQRAVTKVRRRVEKAGRLALCDAETDASRAVAA